MSLNSLTILFVSLTIYTTSMCNAFGYGANEPELLSLNLCVTESIIGKINGITMCSFEQVNQAWWNIGLDCQKGAST